MVVEQNSNVQDILAKVAEQAKTQPDKCKIRFDITKDIIATEAPIKGYFDLNMIKIEDQREKFFYGNPDEADPLYRSYMNCRSGAIPRDDCLSIYASLKIPQNAQFVNTSRKRKGVVVAVDRPFNGNEYGQNLFAKCQ